MPQRSSLDATRRAQASHRLRPLFELATFTGLRRGEICGLHWSDVDLAGRTIVVRHNRVTVNGHVEVLTTKTRSGRRIVPLSDAAVDVLLTGSYVRPGMLRSLRRRGRPMATC
jgi:integrase